MHTESLTSALPGPCSAGAAALALLCTLLSTTAANAGGRYQDLEALRSVAFEHLHSRLGRADADIHVDGTDPRLRLWACEQPIEAALSPGSQLRGRTAVVLRCPAPAWKLVMTAQIGVRRSIVVAARPLLRGTVLTAADLQVTAVDETQAGTTWIDDPKPAIGRLLQTALPAGAPLPPDALADPVSVRRGETLELVVRHGAMRISAGGVALADGRPGERLRAKNLASGRIVEGRLEGERTLLVD